MKLLSPVLLLGLADINLEFCGAFQYFAWRRSSRDLISTQRSVVSKPSRGSERRKPIKSNYWDDFKRAVYNSVDAASDFSSEIMGEKKGINSGVSDGYSLFEQSMKKEPGQGSTLTLEYEARASALGVDKEIPSSSPERKSRTTFEAFKENLYSASDAFDAPSPTEPEASPLAKLERSIPYKRSLARELGVDTETVEDLLSDNPVRRFKAQQEIQEIEARQRAETRNERFRARKEGLYKIVDAMQVAVDSFPESFDKTERVVKATVMAVSEMPTQLEKAIEGTKAIPTSIRRRIDGRKRSIDASISKAKEAVNEVVDIPNKMTKKVQDTKQTFNRTKESIREGITNTKVFLRLEKPKPKPPKLPPPKPKTAKDIALNTAGRAATGAGKVTWWATKSIATTAWNGASSALRERQFKASKQPRQPISAPAPPSVVEKQAAELQKEVDEALRIADETLRKVDEE